MTPSAAAAARRHCWLRVFPAGRCGGRKLGNAVPHHPWNRLEQAARHCWPVAQPRAHNGRLCWPLCSRSSHCAPDPGGWRKGVLTKPQVPAPAGGQVMINALRDNFSTDHTQPPDTMRL